MPKAVEQSSKTVAVRPLLRLTLAKEEIFMGPGPAQLLELIAELQSVRQACAVMELSYSKGWQILKRIEKELGYPIVSRQAGGSQGGSTTLNEAGRQFLSQYQALNAAAKELLASLFQEHFPQF